MLNNSKHISSILKPVFFIDSDGSAGLQVAQMPIIIQSTQTGDFCATAADKHKKQQTYVMITLPPVCVHGVKICHKFVFFTMCEVYEVA